MYYEINVALHGHHFFATAERSITSEHKLKEVLKVFIEKFPKSEGYGISITYQQTIGKILPVESILE